MFKTIVALFMAIVMFTAPFLAIAQQAEKEAVRERARADAEEDAKADTSSALWFVAGCLGGGIGIIISYVSEPSPPAARLVGKSDEYVAFYTDFYKEKAGSIQTSQAWKGCGASVAVPLAILTAELLDFVIDFVID